MSPPINAFIIDDSAVVRKVVAAILQEDPGIRVLGKAQDPLRALEKMAVQWPDVIILDIEMPRMDGLTFLKKIMRERPTPVIICSTLTEKGTAISVEALSAGAVEVIAKPKLGLRDFLSESAALLLRAVKAAAQARISPITGVAARSVPPGTLVRETMMETTEYVVALGMSTGGTQALQRILTGMGHQCPPLMVVQHMPEKFTAAYAQRLDQLCPFEVREAENGDRVRPGRVLIAPGHRHMQLVRSGAQYYVSITDGPPVSRHKPSVDVLFRSVSRNAGRNAIGIIMTGMGNDGARGLLEMAQAGAVTAAQDEASSVVFGMPREAVALGATSTLLPLDTIGDFILRTGPLRLRRPGSAVQI